MKLWHKILITMIAMLITSYLAGRLWFNIFDFIIPSYIAGMVGGLAAIPVWELMRKISSKYP
ncbi:hypothetical protein [Sulfurirhabdus autotrophica]|uniref:Uncharacterized protein n=1 Tax=Sulfurirhabdus autotrophica TaxID=1706046 RepID=A0A4R3YAM7_9PROT|nr:hypothetical protein [Sulfurirhabdus autotrophica]TCV89057.1 hypothetical protein EDC63_103129 [Sulfurirhabdus autotrophica]